MFKLIGTLALIGLTSFVATAQQEKKATLKVKLNYTGSGAVNDTHKIHVFLFDSPDFVQGGVMPFASESASGKAETLTFPEVGVPTVYVVAVYDPTGGYDGQSGPPPSGSSMGMYTTEPGKPGPVKMDSGKPVEIELAFDDTAKMP